MSPRAAGAAAPVQPRRSDPARRGRPAEPTRGERPLEAVRPDPRRRSWQVGTLAGAVLFVALFAIAGAQALIVQRQQHLDAVEERIQVAEQEAEDLRTELAELQSPERIIGEAVERLGMVERPASPLYLQPGADDDARAAEVPPASPSTTVAAGAGR